jgi:hypothetical protein
MLFQDVTPDTSGYMVAGYAIFFVIFAIYLLSLFLRTRNLRKDLGVLAAMKTEDRPRKSAARASSAAASGRKAGSRKKR